MMNVLKSHSNSERKLIEKVYHTKHRLYVKCNKETVIF